MKRPRVGNRPGVGARPRVNRARLAELLGYDVTTVDKWRRAGCPCHRRGRSIEFDLAEVFRWREERIRADSGPREDPRQIDLDAYRRRRARATTERAELELAQLRGEVVEVETVVELLSAEYENVRARLLAQPARLAPRLERLKTRAKIETELDRAIREVLGELSTADDLAQRSIESARAPRGRSAKSTRTTDSRP